MNDRKEEQFPCQYSTEKLNEKARKAIEDVEAGRVTPHEELKKRFMENKNQAKV